MLFTHGVCIVSFGYPLCGRGDYACIYTPCRHRWCSALFAIRMYELHFLDLTEYIGFDSSKTVLILLYHKYCSQSFCSLYIIMEEKFETVQILILTCGS